MGRSFSKSDRLAFVLALASSLSACRTVSPALEGVTGSAVGTAPRRELTEFRKEVIEEHRQIYAMSCIPSSVEMVLKLLGRAPADYYELQMAWQNKSDGNFRDFDNKTISGVTFHQQFSLPRNRRFPLDQLFDTISKELKAGRYVIVGLASGHGWHNWVIYDEGLDGEFIAVTKAGQETVELQHVKKAISEMKGTDIGIYELSGHE